MSRDRIVGSIFAVVAMAFAIMIVYVGDSPSKLSTYVLYPLYIGCTLRAMMGLGKVQPDDSLGEMGDLRPTRDKSGHLWGFIGIPVALWLSLLFVIDDLEERGRLQEIRGEVFVIAFVFTAISVLKLPSWGYSLPFFFTIFVSATGFFLVYLFSKKSGVELN